MKIQIGGGSVDVCRGYVKQFRAELRKFRRDWEDYQDLKSRGICEITAAEIERFPGVIKTSLRSHVFYV